MGQIENLATFVRIVDSGSISKAAEQMGTAKSAVSRRLVELEKDLGVQLLVRTTRKSSLTDAGQSTYHRALQILSDMDELRNAACTATTELQGRLKIAVPLSFGLQQLTSVITEFSQLHPKLSLHVDLSDRKVDLVEDGFDVAIRISSLQDSTLIARRIAPINIVVCASPEYLRKHGEPQKPSDLRDHKSLHYSLIPGAKWKFLTPEGKHVSAVINVNLSSNNGNFLCEAAVRGQGILRTPTFIASDKLASGELRPILSTFKIAPISAYALYPLTRHRSRKVRTFIDFVSDKFEGEPIWDIQAESIGEELVGSQPETGIT